MDHVMYWNQENLCKFLSKFLQKKRPEAGTQDEDVGKQHVRTEPRLRRSCLYCGQDEDPAGNLREAVCADCKREMLQQERQFQQLVEETIHNVEYMFMISWDKRIRIQTHAFLKPCSPDAAKKESEKTAGPFWENSIEPAIMQFKIDDGEQLCDLKIRLNVPAGTVAAAMVHIVIQHYLSAIPEQTGLRSTWIPGLTAWYTVHYLYCMDHERYAGYYDTKLKTCMLDTGKFYEKLCTLQSPQGQWIVSLDQGLRMAQKIEIDSASDDDLADDPDDVPDDADE